MTRELADRYYAFRLRTQPEIAYFTGVELERHDGLSDNSPAGQAEIQNEEDMLWQQLQGIDATALQGSVDWITHGILQQSLQSARELRVCAYSAWAVSRLLITQVCSQTRDCAAGWPVGPGSGGLTFCFTGAAR